MARSQQGMLWLQRAAGNSAVGHLQRAPDGIAVHEGSQWSADEFADQLKKNKSVPESVRKQLGSKKGSLVLSGKVRPEKGTIGEYTEGFNDAFKHPESAPWEITTAKSKIDVTKGKDGKLTWNQIVTPDLAPKEQLGNWVKTGPGVTSFMKGMPFNSDLPEIIYGWTQPDLSNLSKRKFGLILILTEIEVTNPAGKTRTFKPGANNIAEAMLHEISIHAGRISVGKPDVHDGSAVIADLVEEIGGFFRTRTSSGELDVSTTTHDILAFIDPKAASTVSPAPAPAGSGAASPAPAATGGSGG